MAPGPKKKEVNTRVFKNMRELRHIKNNCYAPYISVENEATSKNQNIETHVDEGFEKKYSKRSISSNWQKYEETRPNSHHDVNKRGEDLEVLISYSEGAGTQLKLQDEKEWEITEDDKASIGINVKDLTNVVNSIPFHKLINLPADVLNEDFISEFTSFAEKWNKCQQPSAKTSPSLTKKAFKHEDVESLDSDLNVIKNYENEPTEETASSKPVLLDGKTENIIYSLASCLSLKTSNEKKAPSIEKEETQHFSDDIDLDFLLSLDLTLKNPIKEVAKVESSKTEVEDWLKSIMDD